MKCLVVGSGGREHALAWKLAQSPLVERVYAAPGNPGTASVAQNVPLAENDSVGLLDFARGQDIDLTVVGPEIPLAGGLADCFRRVGRPVFGPGAASARLESSKVFAKDFMGRHGIPTAFYRVAASRAEAAGALRAWGERPLVVKVDGLAAGKGVFVCDRRAEAEAALDEIFNRGSFGVAGGRVVLEEKLAGREVSLLVVGDGHGHRRLLSARDHKKVGEGDTGPNTGGMGAVAPAPLFDAGAGRAVDELIVRPVFDALEAEGIAYPGVLYFGLMMTAAGPRVLEFNVRFGDPETQVVLPLLESDLAALLFSAARGELPKGEPVFRRGSAACVVMASRGYPGDYRRGFPVTGLAAAEKNGLLVFHAGARVSDGTVCTSGGRVLGVTALGETLGEALGKVYAGIGVLGFEGAFYRRDIGAA